MKSILLSAILLAISGTAMSSVADGQYIIKVLTPGVGVKPPEPTGISCKEIKANHPDAKSGAYTIQQAGRKIKTYCNMTLDGGGWTLVQLRAGNSERYSNTDDLSTQGFVSGKGIGVANDVWSSLVASSSQLMMYYNDSGYAYLKISRAKAANCKPLSTVTLNVNLLWHNEGSGCDKTGMDYSVMGHDSNIYLRSSAYTYSPVYDRVVDAYTYIISNGKVFVR